MFEQKMNVVFAVAIATSIASSSTIYATTLNIADTAIDHASVAKNIIFEKKYFSWEVGGSDSNATLGIQNLNFGFNLGSPILSASHD